MKPLLQHLQPADSPDDDGEARRMLGTLQDLDRHLGSQAVPRMLTSLTGRRVLGMMTLPADAADVGPYDRNYPSSLGTAPNASERVQALAAQLQGAFDLPLVPLQTPDRHQMFVLGFAAGGKVGESWEVSHLGSNLWRCRGGVVRGGGVASNTQRVSDAEVRIDQGFIGFSVSLSPYPAPGDEESFVFGIRARSLEGRGSWVNQGPVRSATASPDIAYTWRGGSMFVPVAYVEAPTASRRPRSIQMMRGVIQFWDRYSAPGLPGYTTAAE